MTQSKVNPDNPDANDYTWQCRAYGAVRAGLTPESKDVCYLEDLADYFTPDDAIQLASDLLGWATFIKEANESRQEFRSRIRIIAEDFGAPLNTDGELASTCTPCAEHGRMNCGTCN